MVSRCFQIYVGNLGYDVSDEDLGSFFQNGNCKVKSVKVQYDRDTRRSRGFAHVEMSDLESLHRALTANSFEFEGRKMQVEVGKQPAARPERDYKDRRGGGRGDYSDDRRERAPRDDRAPRDRRADQPEDRAPLARGAQVPAAAEEPTAEAPKERKKVVIQPRSVPIGAAVDTSVPSSYSSIFGGAKPRDEVAIEVVI